jgi:hypothetical protein
LKTFAWHRIHELTDSVSVCRRSMPFISGSAGQRGGLGHGHRAWSSPPPAVAAHTHTQQTAQGEHEAASAVVTTRILIATVHAAGGEPGTLAGEECFH